MSKYNGHKSWNQWNVSLWINNDEGLYREAYNLVRRYGAEKATCLLLDMLQGQKTPDGAIYNKTSIRNALVGIL